MPFQAGPSPNIYQQPYLPHSRGKVTSLMNSNLLNMVAVGFFYGMALVGFFSLIGFIAGVFQDWIGAKRKINTDVPELKDSVRELKLKLSFLESDIKRLERSRRHDPLIGKALLDEPPTEAGGS